MSQFQNDGIASSDAIRILKDVIYFRIASQIASTQRDAILFTSRDVDFPSQHQNQGVGNSPSHFQKDGIAPSDAIRILKTRQIIYGLHPFLLQHKGIPSCPHKSPV
jgi:hypothetical protein